MVDVVFFVDLFGSIGKGNWGKMLDFLKEMVKVFNVGLNKMYIVVVVYSIGVKVEF